MASLVRSAVSTLAGRAPAIPAQGPRVPDAVKRTFQAIPNTRGLRVTDEEMGEMYRTFRSRVGHVDAPTAEEYRATSLARTILSAPRGLAYALMDRVSRGDKCINSGAYKDVYHAVGLHDGQHYAVGVCDTDRHSGADTIQLLRREEGFADELQGAPGIVEIPLCFEEGRKFYFVMKFYQKGELNTLIEDLLRQRKTYPLPKRIALCRKILQGIAEAHRRNLIHRDIKPENILQDERGDPFLSDFGLATKTDDQSPFGIGRAIGTPEFVAPEIARHELSTQKYDTWSAGVLLYNILALDRLPWQEEETTDDILEAIPQRTSWSPRFRHDFNKQDKQIKDLLRQMLKVDPDERLSIAQALERLEAIEKALDPRPAAPKARTQARVQLSARSAAAASVRTLPSIQEEEKDEKEAEEVFASPRPQSSPQSKPASRPPSRPASRPASRPPSRPISAKPTVPSRYVKTAPAAKAAKPLPKPMKMAPAKHTVPSRYVKIAMPKFQTPPSALHQYTPLFNGDMAAAPMPQEIGHVEDEVFDLALV